MANLDYYAILQVHPEADREVIIAAYRKLAVKHHPDVNALPDATERMKRLNEAYAVLSEPARRADYDRLRKVTSARESPPGRERSRFIVPVGLLAFILIASRLGIRLALLMLVLAVVIWVCTKS
ncbi:DnaJ domain-containing protein [candidate division NPL-UPA2 bacterium]|nr:DnaJ domain-containing protein [candidate division NPL-UPA2 bacterium]